MEIKKEDVGRRVWDFSRGWGEIKQFCTGDYPISVLLDSGIIISFSVDGRYSKHHSTSLFWDEIKFTEPPRPKRMIKKTIEKWINIYSSNLPTIGAYPCEDQANQFAAKGRIACVKLTGEYEVEIDE